MTGGTYLALTSGRARQLRRGWQLIAILLGVGLALLGTLASGGLPSRRAAFTAGPQFTANIKLTRTAHATLDNLADAEPSIRTSAQNDTYVVAPDSVPGGCDFWKVHPDGAGSDYKGVTDGTAGGGDCDLATSAAPEPPPVGNNLDVIAASSLTLGNVTTSASFDGGNTWVLNPAGQQVTGVDREWNAAGAASNPLEFYMSYGDFPLAFDFLAKSENGGVAYTQTGPTQNGTTAAAHHGNIVVDATGQSIYMLFTNNTAENQVWLASSTNGGLTWSQNIVHDGTSSGQTYGHIFQSLAMDPQGQNLFAVYSDEHNVHLATSPVAKATTGPWTDSIVPTLDGTQTNIMPWVSSGAAGTADVVWYGTPDASETSASPWNVYFARFGLAGATFALSKVSDHVVHTGFVCEQGGGCTGTVGTSGDRSMLDYFENSDGPDGVAHVAFTDTTAGDHTIGSVYYAQELPGTVQSPSPGTSPSASPSSCASPSPLTSPTPSTSPSPSASPSASTSPSPSASPSASASPSPSPSGKGHPSPKPKATTRGVYAAAITATCGSPSPGPSPTTSPTPCPSPSSCPPLYTSPSGDAPNKAPGDTSNGANVDNLDLTGGIFGNSKSGSSFTARLLVKNLATPPPLNATSENWYAQFSYNGTDYYAGAALDTNTGAVTYAIGTAATSSTGTTYTPTVNTIGTFDQINNRIDILVPLSAIGNPPDGAVLTGTVATAFIGQGAGVSALTQVDRSPRTAGASFTSDTAFGTDWVVGTACTLP